MGADKDYDFESENCASILKNFHSLESEASAEQQIQLIL